MKKPLLLDDTRMRSAEGHLIWGAFDSTELVREYGTPLYVLDGDLIEKNWIRIYRAVKSAHTRSIICYAYKANSHFAVCKLLTELGAGAEVASGGELRLSLDVGVPPNHIVFDGPFKTEEEIATAISNHVMINADSSSDLRRIESVAQNLGIEAKVGVRINPNISVETHAFLSTALEEHKFGVSIEDAFELCRAVRLNVVDLVGLHIHLGSNLKSVDAFEIAARTGIDFAARLKRILGINISSLDLGGGLGLTEEGESAISLEEFATSISKIIGEAERNLGELTLILEPGRQLVANSGILLTRVGAVKESPHSNWVIVDSGMNHLIRPALYGAFHPIVLANREGADRDYTVYSVGGPCCESGDFLAKDRKMPRLEENDILAVMNTGAYGFTMSSNYNLYPRPAVVMTRHGKPFLIRKRESYEDMMKLEIADTT